MTAIERPRISVLIITYNQEKLISRALDSLICQREFLYEICINDDKSTDNTFKILQEYQTRYPDLIKPVRNEKNLFVFANTEASWKRASGDLIYQLAGDDAVNEHFFETVSNYVVENHLNCSRNKFCIYTDYEQIEPSGLRIRYSNAMVSHHDPLKLKIRGLISPRGLFISRPVLDSFVNVSNGRSYAVESAQDIQPQIFAENNYHIPFVGEVYYSGIGVSVTMSNEERLHRSKEINKFLLDFLDMHNVVIDRTDKQYILFIDIYRQWQHTHKLSLIPSLLGAYIGSLDFSLGFNTLLINEMLMVLKKKIYNKCRKNI